MLTVVHLIAGGGIHKGTGSPAGRGFLFEQQDGYTGSGKVDGRSKSAESAANDYDRGATG
jgi:hypothetical protein